MLFITSICLPKRHHLLHLLMAPFSWTGFGQFVFPTPVTSLVTSLSFHIYEFILPCDILKSVSFEIYMFLYKFTSSFHKASILEKRAVVNNPKPFRLLWFASHQPLTAHNEDSYNSKTPLHYTWPRLSQCKEYKKREREKQNPERKGEE